MSRLLSKSLTRSRNIGSQAARKIEKACGKPQGWLDINHSTVSASEISAEEIAVQYSALSRELSIMIEGYACGKMSRERQLEVINALLKTAKSLN